MSCILIVVVTFKASLHFTCPFLCRGLFLSKGGWGDSPLKKRERNWVDLLSQRLLGMLLGPRKKNWPIADRRVPSNDPRNTCGTHFGSSSLLVFQVANLNSLLLFWSRLKDEREIRLRKSFFSALRASVWPKNKVGVLVRARARARAPSLPLAANVIQYNDHNISSFLSKHMLIISVHQISLWNCYVTFNFWAILKK